MNKVFDEILIGFTFLMVVFNGIQLGRIEKKIDSFSSPSEASPSALSTLLALRAGFIESQGAGLHFFPPHKRSRFTETCPYFGQQELSVIRKAAERNSCCGDDFLILLAIRKAENGRDKLAFGIMDERANTFELQARWCAATIVKNRGRWEKAGKPENFTKWFSIRYCPLDYINWERNVRFWVEKLKVKM